MELLTSRTSRAKPDSIPSASFWFASSLSRLGQSRKDQTCRSCLWRSVPGRISLRKLCENRWLVNYPALICLSRDALKAIENFYYNYIPIFSSSFVVYTVPPFLYLPGNRGIPQIIRYFTKFQRKTQPVAVSKQTNLYRTDLII